MKKDERKLLEKINKIATVKKNFDPSIFKIETKEKTKKKKMNLGFLAPIFASIIIVLLVQSINIKGTNNSEPIPPLLDDTSSSNPSIGENPSSPSKPDTPEEPGNTETPSSPSEPNSALLEYFLEYDEMDASANISLKDLVNNELNEIAQNILENKYLDSPSTKSKHSLFINLLQTEIINGNYDLNDIIIDEDLEENIFSSSLASKPEIGNLNQQNTIMYILEYFETELNK